MFQSLVCFWALSGRSFFCELPFLVAISKTPYCFLWTRVNCGLARGLREGFCLLVCESVVEICWPPMVTWLLYSMWYVSPLSSGKSLYFFIWLANSWLFLFLMRTLCRQSRGCTKNTGVSRWSPFRCPSLNDKHSMAIPWVTVQPILTINTATAFQSLSVSFMVEATHHWG